VTRENAARFAAFFCRAANATDREPKGRLSLS
jgi:hypothetical protein